MTGQHSTAQHTAQDKVVSHILPRLCHSAYMFPHPRVTAHGSHERTSIIVEHHRIRIKSINGIEVRNVETD